MDIKDIQELIKFVAKSGATEVDLEIDNVKISIKSPAMKAGKVIEPPVTVVSDIPVATSFSCSRSCRNSAKCAYSFRRYANCN